jgi:hypothetical protein
MNFCRKTDAFGLKFRKFPGNAHSIGQKFNLLVYKAQVTSLAIDVDGNPPGGWVTV